MIPTHLHSCYKQIICAVSHTLHHQERVPGMASHVPVAKAYSLEEITAVVVAKVRQTMPSWVLNFCQLVGFISRNYTDLDLETVTNNLMLNSAEFTHLNGLAATYTIDILNQVACGEHRVTRVDLTEYIKALKEQKAGIFCKDATLSNNVAIEVLWSGLAKLGAEATGDAIASFLSTYQSVPAMSASAAAVSAPTAVGAADGAAEPLGAEGSQGSPAATGSAATTPDNKQLLNKFGFKLRSTVQAASESQNSPLQQAFAKALEAFYVNQVCFGKSAGISPDRHALCARQPLLLHTSVSDVTCKVMGKSRNLS